MPTDLEVLAHALKTIANIDEDDFSISTSYWQKKNYKKGEYYNEYRNVCKYLGFILDGVFRTYYVDDDTGGDCDDEAGDGLMISLADL